MNITKKILSTLFNIQLKNIKTYISKIFEDINVDNLQYTLIDLKYKKLNNTRIEYIKSAAILNMKDLIKIIKRVMLSITSVLYITIIVLQSAQIIAEILIFQISNKKIESQLAKNELKHIKLQLYEHIVPFIIGIILYTSLLALYNKSILLKLKITFFTLILYSLILPYYLLNIALSAILKEDLLYLETNNCYMPLYLTTQQPNIIAQSSTYNLFLLHNIGMSLAQPTSEFKKKCKFIFAIIFTVIYKTLNCPITLLKSVLLLLILMLKTCFCLTIQMCINLTIIPIYTITLLSSKWTYEQGQDDAKKFNIFTILSYVMLFFLLTPYNIVHTTLLALQKQCVILKQLSFCVIMFILQLPIINLITSIIDINTIQNYFLYKENKTNYDKLLTDSNNAEQFDNFINNIYRYKENKCIDILTERGELDNINYELNIHNTRKTCMELAFHIISIIVHYLNELCYTLFASIEKYMKSLTTLPQQLTNVESTNSPIVQQSID